MFRLSGTTSKSAGLNAMDELSDSMNSIISDIEEEGEVEEPAEEGHSHVSITESLADEIAAGHHDLSASDELVASMAKSLSIIEASMRHHQATGTANFHDQHETTEEQEQPSQQSFSACCVGKCSRKPRSPSPQRCPVRIGLACLCCWRTNSHSS